MKIFPLQILGTQTPSMLCRKNCWLVAVIGLAVVVKRKLERVKKKKRTPYIWWWGTWISAFIENILFPNANTFVCSLTSINWWGVGQCDDSLIRSPYAVVAEVLCVFGRLEMLVLEPVISADYIGSYVWRITIIAVNFERMTIPMNFCGNARRLSKEKAGTSVGN